MRIPAADLSPGDTTWLHIRAVSYAGGRGPIRSIPVRPPADLSGIAAAASAAPNVPGFTPPGPSFSPILAPAVRPPTAPARAPTVPNAGPNGVRNSPTSRGAVTRPEVR